GQAKICVDLSTLPRDVELVVRRGGATAPLEAGQGQAVWAGPARPVLEDGGAPSGTVTYSVLTRQRRRSGWGYSRAVSVALIAPMPGPLRELAESAAGAPSVDQPEPARVGLLFQAVDNAEVAAALAESALPQVRSWALRRLAAAPEITERAEAVLWSALRDAVPSLRLLAAKTLLTGPQPGPDRVRRVIDTLGGGDIDASIQAAKSLRGLGVAAQLLDATIALLEGERPSTCPECKIGLASRDRFAHLVTRHGYLDVDGALLPRPAALSRLW